jgi:hypothetical protein
MTKFLSQIRAAYVSATTVNPLAARLIEDNKAFMASSRGWKKANVL